jgi:hypothetical protein
MIAWTVILSGKSFTFITDQCLTPESVKAAMFEKFCRHATSVERLT